MKLAQIENCEITGIIEAPDDVYIPGLLKVPDEAQIGDKYIKGIFYPQDQTIKQAKYEISRIDAQITELENKTYRPLREISLGLDTDGTAATKLSDLNAQITALRVQREELTSAI